MEYGVGACTRAPVQMTAQNGNCHCSSGAPGIQGLVATYAQDCQGYCFSLFPVSRPCAPLTPLPCPALLAVVIALPSASSFYAATMYDVAIRVGNNVPNTTVDPSEINYLCAFRTGRLGSRGQIVRVACTDGTPVGKVVTIQIR